MKIKVLELFGGIGALSKALERLGIDYEIADYVEIDKYAVKSFNAIHNTNFEPQDICEWDKDIEVDLIMHGSPCQDFSLAGKQAGGDEGSGTRSSLMYETIRIVEKLKPKYVIWENVKNLLSKKHRHNFDAYLETMEQLGYTNYYQVLNAKNYGIPQNRERVFTISIRKDIDKGYTFPEPQELKLKLKDMLEDEVDEKYYLSEKMIEFFYKNEQVQKEKGNGFRFGVSDGNVIAKAVTTRAGSRMDDNFLKIKEATKKGYKEAYEGDGVNISSRIKYQRGNVQKESIQTITTSGGNDRGVVVNEPMIYDDRDKGWGIKITDICPTQRAMRTGIKCIYPNLRIRKLTPKECWRLMGFDDGDYEKAAQVNSNTQLYKQAGNSIVVNVLEAILTNLLK
jgi:DNA (cytosine-5)-methyltransferase 1